MNKLSTLSRMGMLILLLTGLLSLEAQIPEPNNFDWKESYDMTTKQEVFYDRDLVASIPNDAMFWVTIQPQVKKLRKSTFVREGIRIYEHSKVIEHKVNGQDFIHGFVEMIQTEGKSFYTLNSDKHNFIESPNQSVITDRPSGPLFSTGLSFENLMQNFQNNGWIPVIVDGKTWFRNAAAELEMNVDESNATISTRDLETGAMSYDKYEEVEPNIWRNTMNVEIIPDQTIEGFCIEKRTTTITDNFSFDINNAGQDARISDESSSQTSQIEVKQESGDLILKRIESQSKFDLMIYDVMGRLVFSEQQIADNRINFSPAIPGIYFIAFIQNGKSEVTKLYLH